MYTSRVKLQSNWRVLLLPVLTGNKERNNHHEMKCLGLSFSFVITFCAEFSKSDKEFPKSTIINISLENGTSQPTAQYNLLNQTQVELEAVKLFRLKLIMIILFLPSHDTMKDIYIMFVMEPIQENDFCDIKFSQEGNTVFRACWWGIPLASTVNLLMWHLYVNVLT